MLLDILFWRSGPHTSEKCGRFFDIFIPWFHAQPDWAAAHSDSMYCSSKKISKFQIVKLVNFQIQWHYSDTDLWQLLSSLQHVLKVAPSVTVRLQIGAQQIAQGDPTQAEPLLQPLALQRFSWARPAWWDTRRRSVTSTDGLSRRLNIKWAETDMQENQEVLGGRTKEDNWKETIGECVCVLRILICYLLLLINTFIINLINPNIKNVELKAFKKILSGIHNFISSSHWMVHLRRI